MAMKKTSDGFRIRQFLGGLLVFGLVVAVPIACGFRAGVA